MDRPARDGAHQVDVFAEFNRQRAMKNGMQLKQIMTRNVETIEPSARFKLLRGWHRSM